MQRLGRADITRGLDALAGELARLNARVELVVVGGAAMALLYDGRASTKDIDVIIAPADQSCALRLRSSAPSSSYRSTGSTMPRRGTCTASRSARW